MSPSFLCLWHEGGVMNWISKVWMNVEIDQHSSMWVSHEVVTVQFCCSNIVNIAVQVCPHLTDWNVQTGTSTCCSRTVQQWVWGFTLFRVWTFALGFHRLFLTRWVQKQMKDVKIFCSCQWTRWLFAGLDVFYTSFKCHTHELLLLSCSWWCKHSVGL